MANPDPVEQAKQDKIRKLGLFLLILPFVLFVLLLAIWPLSVADDGMANTLLSKRVPAEIALFLIVLLSGALGSSVFTSRSFAAYLGKDKFELEWFWWYLLRVPIGMGLALILYLVLRGGQGAGVFAEAVNDPSKVNPFGFASVSALAGMFAKHAANKLSEVFDTLFRTERPEWAGKRPKITSFAKESFKVGATKEADLKLTVHGTGFHEKAIVGINGDERPTSFVDSTRITATLLATDVAEPKILTVTVLNPEDEGGSSAPAKIEIVA